MLVTKCKLGLEPLYLVHFLPQQFKLCIYAAVEAGTSLVMTLSLVFSFVPGPPPRVMRTHHRPRRLRHTQPEPPSPPPPPLQRAGPNAPAPR